MEVVGSCAKLLVMQWGAQNGWGMARREVRGARCEEHIQQMCIIHNIGALQCAIDRERRAGEDLAARW